MPDDTSTLTVSAENGDVTVANIDAEYETVTIEVVDTTPTAFEGIYSVAVDDLADGVALLAAPLLDGAAQIGQSLTGSVALWIYDSDAYAAAARAFVPSRQWHRDGQPLPDETGFTVTIDAPGRYTLVESVETPDGTTLAAVSNAIAVSGGVDLTSELMDGRWIDLSGIVPDSRKLLVVAVLDNAMGFGSATASSQLVLARQTTNTTSYDHPVNLAIRSNRMAFRASSNDLAVNALPLTGSIPLDTITPRRLYMVAVGTLDKYGDGPAAGWSATDLALNETTLSQSTLVAPATPMSLNGFLAVNRGLGADPATAVQRLAAGTKLRMLWIATDYPDPFDSRIETVRTAVQEAFFMVSGTAPTLVVSEKAMAADGTITIEGKPVTPVVFLAGEHFGQYDDGGIKRLVNRGTGTDPELNGDWFA